MKNGALHETDSCMHEYSSGPCSLFLD